MKTQEIIDLEKLNKYGIEVRGYAYDEIGRLKSLNILSHKIIDMSFLKEFTNLTNLYLRNSQIKDISFLKGLTNLTNLDLSNNQISDVSFLKGLTNLTILNLNNIQISDVSFLKDLTNLTNLSLNDNKINDISVVKELGNLTYLSLSNNQISDISSIKDLTNLNKLSLSHNRINDISFLKKLINLNNLGLSSNQISDISFLKGLINLIHLSLGYNQIRDISFIKEFKDLTHLSLGNNLMSDLSALEELTKLNALSVNQNHIRDISFLKGLTNLIRLSLHSNQISDISSLKELTQLSNLNLNSNQISDISSLEKLNNLVSLSLNNNRIRDISFLKKLANLTKLSLSSNQIKDTSSLKALINLNDLSLSNNQIKDILPLKTLTNLTYLSLSNNQIKDISLLERLAKLGHIDLSANKIKIHPAYWSPKLYSCNINNNPLTYPPIGIVNQGKEAIKKYFEEVNLNTNNLTIKDADNDKLNIKKNNIEEARIEEISTEKAKTEKVPIVIKPKSKPKKKGTKTLYEAKLVLIGNGEVGKSSIRTKLMDRNAELPKLSTHGIDTFEWTIKVKYQEEDIDFKLNIWDFGGQGEYRSIQQFFCTRNSVYIYVTSHDDEAINNKDEYVGFDYWYPFVQAYGYNEDTEQFSPLLHVRNKKDKKVLPIDEKVFQDLYPDIYSEYLQVSCTTLENIDRLEEVIKMILPHASNDMFSREYPISWMRVKEELEIMRRKTYNYISLADYEEICHNNNMDLEAAAIWLKELDNIGTVIYFGKIKSLENLVILNPEWLKEAAYRILKKQAIRKDYGVFKDFSEVWKGGPFPKELHPQLEKLMLSFEICYLGKDERNKPTYYVPSLFPSRTEEERNVFDEIIEEHEVEGFLYEFKLKYDLYMPAGILHKLVVRHNKETQSQYRWRDCAILYYKGTYAEIVENWKEKQIEFKIKGKSPEGLFRFIKKAIDKISQELVDVKFIKPLTYKITAYYRDEDDDDEESEKEDNYESLKSLKKIPEARKIFWFLFDDKKPVKENARNTLSSFRSELLVLLENEQQNAVADILAQIKESNYNYNKIQYKDIENSMGVMSQGIQAQNIVNTTKMLIRSLKEE